MIIKDFIRDNGKGFLISLGFVLLGSMFIFAKQHKDALHWEVFIQWLPMPILLFTCVCLMVYTGFCYGGKK